MRKSLFLPYFIFIAIIMNEGSVYAHTNKNGSLVISFEEFFFINLIILVMSLGLVYMIDQFQKNKKLISLRKLILIVVSTLFVNAIISINTYVEIE